MQTIRPGSAAEWESVRELFREYWGSFGFSACFQDFESEVAGLPGAYAPPGGALVLALIDGQAAGCAALRRFDAQRGEAKRLYVRPEFRGRGVGRAGWDTARWSATRFRRWRWRLPCTIAPASSVPGRMRRRRRRERSICG